VGEGPGAQHTHCFLTIERIRHLAAAIFLVQEDINNKKNVHLATSLRSVHIVLYGTPWQVVLTCPTSHQRPTYPRACAPSNACIFRSCNQHPDQRATTFSFSFKFLIPPLSLSSPSPSASASKREGNPPKKAKGRTRSTRSF
jgi:hypothetical protein